MTQATTSVWGTRPDGVRVGVVPCGAGHPRPTLRGRWHVLVAAPGRAPVVMSPPVPQGEERVIARRLWQERRPA